MKLEDFEISFWIRNFAFDVLTLTFDQYLGVR